MPASKTHKAFHKPHKHHIDQSPLSLIEHSLRVDESKRRISPNFEFRAQ